MIDLIHTVAEMTHLRNQKALEASFGRAIFALATAARLSVWHAPREGTGRKLRERLCLPGCREMPREVDLLGAPDAWRECLATRQPVMRVSPAGHFEYVFALCDDKEVRGLLEIDRPARLPATLMQMVNGLAQVYGNHLGLLDYSVRDDLTGLLNRRTFAEVFMQVAEAPVVDAAIAVVDIDFFKRVNDMFGHAYGDEVLILMARLMAEHFLGWDGLFRFGGEEFLVVMTETVQEEAWMVLDAFRAAVAATNFPLVGRVTVSVGFSMVRPGDTGAAAFGRADQALYVAKHSGRNRVKCHEVLVSDGTFADVAPASGEMEIF